MGLVNVDGYLILLASPFPRVSIPHGPFLSLLFFAHTRAPLSVFGSLLLLCSDPVLLVNPHPRLSLKDSTRTCQSTPMAPISKSLALAGALYAACGLAAPVEKRAVVWETVTDVVWTTVEVTTTIYPTQHSAATATPAAATAVPTAAVSQQESEHQRPAPQPETSTVAPPEPQPETTTVALAPAPQPTERSTIVPEPTSTSQAPAATSTTSPGNTLNSGYTGPCDESSPCTGQMTFYDTATTATNPSACGTTNDGLTELVLALPHGIMSDSDCGKSVTIHYNGVTQTGKVVDKCMGCDNTSVDLSRALFESFASLAEGRLSGATWYIQ